MQSVLKSGEFSSPAPIFWSRAQGRVQLEVTENSDHDHRYTNLRNGIGNLSRAPYSHCTITIKLSVLRLVLAWVEGGPLETRRSCSAKVDVEATVLEGSVSCKRLSIGK